MLRNGEVNESASQLQAERKAEDENFRVMRESAAYAWMCSSWRCTEVGVGGSAATQDKHQGSLVSTVILALSRYMQASRACLWRRAISALRNMSELDRSRLVTRALRSPKRSALAGYGAQEAFGSQCELLDDSSLAIIVDHLQLMTHITELACRFRHNTVVCRSLECLGKCWLSLGSSADRDEQARGLA